MRPLPSAADAVHDWIVVGLRSAEQNAVLARQARRAGLGFIGVPALSLRPAADCAIALAHLRAALDCPLCLFTSPAAVLHADRLQRLSGWRGLALAVGSGTAAALRRAGVDRVATPPTGMHSEGLLALPELAMPDRIGLVSAPGGRGMLEPVLRERGAEVCRADVYRRACGRIGRRHADAIVQADRPLAVLVTSGEALDCALAALPPSPRVRLLAALAVTSSERLQHRAEQCGFERTVLAASPRWPELLAAIRGHAKPDAIR